MISEMDEAWHFFQKKMKGDEMTRKGRDDLGQDNQLQPRAFLDVRGQTSQEDASQKKCANVPVNHSFNLMASMKRADAVSPQAADVVEKVMSEDCRLTQKQTESQYQYNNNQSLERDHSSSTSPRIGVHQPTSQDSLSLQKQNSDERFGLQTSVNTSQISRSDSSLNLNEADLEQNTSQREQENGHSTRNGYDRPTDIKRSYASSPIPNQGEDEFKADLDQSLSSAANNSFEISDLQRSRSFSASFHDDSSNSSESSFLVSHPGSAHPSSYSRDPVTGQYSYQPNKEGVYFCHLCSFSGTTRSEFEDHMTCHFEHICPHCNYKSRTEGRLKRHIKDFHTDDPPDGFGSKRNMGRPKVFRCKQCDFVATEKTDFWQHARSHIKEEKLLQCPRCEFVTEYKHHLEYHLRNHFGSKPFKCNKCNYSCVNKSMLNSHMKSHTNVYQYRCADCTYATKYCHSLKLHLRKYNHKPATVLNTDGSLPQGIDAESSGLSLLQKRGPPRGPRGPRKDKFDPFVGHLLSLPQNIPGIPPGLNGSMMSPYWPLLGQMPNGLHPPPPLVPTSVTSNMPPMPQNKLSPSPAFNFRAGIGSSNAPFKCNFCSFASEVKHDLFKHVMKVHASENQDLFSIFGISSEALLEEQSHRMTALGHHRMPMKFGASPEKMNPYNSALHVKTEHGEKENTKSSPHSWPHGSPPEPKRAKIDRGPSQYSMPELNYNRYINGGASPKVADGPGGEDIIKQMMHKFGSGMPMEPSHSRSGGQVERVYRESPLDLTKPRSPSDDYDGLDLGQGDNLENEAEISSSGENSVSMDMQAQSPRKRSRKGKAFKLDTLCLKLQEKQAESPFNSEQGDGESDMMDDSEGLQIDEVDYKDGPEAESEETQSRNRENQNKNKMEDETTKENGEDEARGSDFEKIHSNLQILNDEIRNERCSTEDVVENERSGNDGKSPLDENNVGVGPVSYDPSSDLVNPEQFMAEVNRRKNLPQPVRRGTEVAWKILQDSNGSNMNQTSPDDHHPIPEAMETPLKYRSPMEMMQFTTTSTPKDRNGHHSPKFECPYCEIAFRDCVMYTMHMGYHGYKDPFKCNMCGYQSRDKVEFFLHIAREAHN